MKLIYVAIVIFILLLVWGNLSRKSCAHPLNAAKKKIPSKPSSATGTTAGDSFTGGGTTVAGVCEPCSGPASCDFYGTRVTLGPKWFSTCAGKKTVGTSGQFWNSSLLAQINARHPDWNIGNPSATVSDGVYSTVQYELSQGVYNASNIPMLPAHVTFPVDPPPVAIQRAPTTTIKKALRL